ncbi:MAG: thioredoxin family protein [Deltaproteobacteria bacterium]|nr:thioredoxin family protein [Deltaproteobacteria bacterium]
MKLKFFIFLFFLNACLSCDGQADSLSLDDGNNYVKGQIICDYEQLPSDPSVLETAPRIAVYLTIEEGWHIYWLNSGDAGIPTQIKWSLPEGFESTETNWPVPLLIEEAGGILTFGYKNSVALISNLKLPQGNIISDYIEIKALVSFLVCKDLCIPGELELNKTLQVVGNKQIASSAQRDLLDNFEKDVPKSIDLIQRENPQLNLKITNSLESAESGDQGMLTFELKNISDVSADNLMAQIFPFRNTNITFDRAYFVKPPKNGKSTFIVLPYKIAAHTKSDNLILAGITSLNKKPFASPTDLSFYWTQMVNLNGHIVNEEFPLAANSKGKLLTFRYSSEVKGNDKFSNKLNYSLMLLPFLAIVAGIILNFMPCVLPVLSLKIYSIVSNAQSSVKVQRQSALGYLLGVEFSFLILALIIIGLKSLGVEVGWGFQFQNPIFVYLLSIIVFLFSLACFDVYQFKLPAGQKIDKLIDIENNIFRKSLLEGILATILATPCSAPFLGTVLAVAFAASNHVTIVLFACIGFGLALPYVIISLNSRLSSFLPRPGVWMIRLKQIMGLLLLATVAWLLSLLTNSSVDGVIGGIKAILAIVLIIVVFRTLPRFHSRYEFLSLVLLISCISYYFLPEPIEKTEGTLREQTGSHKIDWLPYSEELIHQYQSENKPIFIMFTADWCLTCKFNEKFIIETNAVVKAISEYKIIPIKGDWSDGNSTITRALKKYGVNWVPFYVILPRNGLPAVFPGTVFTPKKLIDTFKQISANGPDSRPVPR